MSIVVLLMLIVALYFLSSDRRYIILASIAVLIEALTLSLMWLFDVPSMLGYGLGIIMLLIALLALLLREDRKVQQEIKPSPIYREHTPVYDEQQCAYTGQDLTDASR
ncbi:hypothetical protein [Acinetobacter sp. B51(2017)]|uniref:hypothetical protein n=1 Tax=Acinetobacter sp. B51(2017) TaxID=2060938 RepID=UPI000F081B7A|nr:hypothetical protein [Acinetobacter sp. B51(2017)]